MTAPIKTATYRPLPDAFLLTLSLTPTFSAALSRLLDVDGRSRRGSESSLTAWPDDACELAALQIRPSASRHFGASKASTMGPRHRPARPFDVDPES